MTEYTRELIQAMRKQAESVLDNKRHFTDWYSRAYHRGMLKVINTIEGSESHADKGTDS